MMIYKIKVYHGAVTYNCHIIIKIKPFITYDLNKKINKTGNKYDININNLIFYFYYIFL